MRGESRVTGGDHRNRAASYSTIEDQLPLCLTHWKKLLILSINTIYNNDNNNALKQSSPDFL